MYFLLQEFYVMLQCIKLSANTLGRRAWEQSLQKFLGKGQVETDSLVSVKCEYIITRI